MKQPVNIEIEKGKVLRLAELHSGDIVFEIELRDEHGKRKQLVFSCIPKERRNLVAAFIQED